jgi:hypothetical protein
MFMVLVDSSHTEPCRALHAWRWRDRSGALGKVRANGRRMGCNWIGTAFVAGFLGVGFGTASSAFGQENDAGGTNGDEASDSGDGSVQGADAQLADAEAPIACAGALCDSTSGSTCSIAVRAPGRSPGDAAASLGILSVAAATALARTRRRGRAPQTSGHRAAAREAR